MRLQTAALSASWLALTVALGAPTIAQSATSGSTERSVPTNGRLYVLQGVTRHAGDRRALGSETFPRPAAFCGQPVTGWITLRGSWWVAVDSVVACAADADRHTGFVHPKNLVAVVDSGFNRGIGADADTMVFQSYLRREMLPIGQTLGLMRGQTLTVFAVGGITERRYTLARP